MAAAWAFAWPEAARRSRALIHPICGGSSASRSQLSIRLAAEAGRRSVDAAGVDELVALVGAGLDIASVDADRRRAEKTLLGRDVGVADLDPAHVGVDAGFGDDTLD
ncbi:MAG: hypothetical protein H0W87_02515 [Actinobacteria bacterium]|nr:hypothetical protein [Actinomycetota bacterium]